MKVNNIEHIKQPLMVWEEHLVVLHLFKMQGHKCVLVTQVLIKIHFNESL